MIDFYFIFLAVIVILFFSSKFDKIFFNGAYFIFCIFIITVAGLRLGIGTDYYSYKEIYGYIAIAKRVELGWKYLNLFFSNVGLSYEFTVFFFSAVINILIFRFIKRYSISPFYSLMLYVFLNYYFIAFNAVRQMLAISIFINGLEFLLRKKYTQFILLTAFAALFHSTALIGLFYIFLRKIKHIGVFIIFWVVSIPFIVLPIQSIIIKIIPSSSRYAVYFTTRFFEKSSNLSLIKLIIPNMFVFLTILFISAFKDSKDYFWLKVFLFSVAVANMANGVAVLMRSNYIFQISEIIFYPLFLSKLSKEYSLPVRYLMFVYFILFFVGTVIVQGAQGVTPYRSILG
ncbi:EpsG family protein [Treponema pedis]|uniref:EpsG family protein n=1 Tax=Treponema pedis TaxID=409322 RepID=UPI003D20BEEE